MDWNRVIIAIAKIKNKGVELLPVGTKKSIVDCVYIDECPELGVTVHHFHYNLPNIDSSFCELIKIPNDNMVRAS